MEIRAPRNIIYKLEEIDNVTRRETSVPEETPVVGESVLTPGHQVLALCPARMVVISLAARVTGLTVRAINGKIDDGHWIEGKEWHRGPDGRRYIDLEGYNSWVARKTSTR